MTSLNFTSGFIAGVDAKTLALASGGIALLYFIISTALSAYRLSHIPGPFLANFSSLWVSNSMLNRRFHIVVRDLYTKYGKLVRLSPNELLLSDAETLWRINSARSAYTRGGWYDSIRLNPYGHSVLSETDTLKHDKRKAKLIFGYSGKGLMNLERNVDTQLAVLVDVLRARTSSSGLQGQAVVDIGRMLQHFQVDLITFTGFGKAWGNLPMDKDHFEYLGRGDDSNALLQAISMTPWLRQVWYSPLFLALFGPSTTEGWLGEIRRSVQRRVQGDKVLESEGDMLDEWFKHGVTPSEAELDLSLQMPAGTESSITTIRSIMMYLMASPRVYRRLKEEITDGIKNGQISRPITNEEGKSLPYLQAVINEGLRIAPPLTGTFPKKVPADGDVICGMAVPEGVEIHTNLLGLMRDQDVFGPDVEIFRPERFINCDEATRMRRLKVVDLSFGYGRWQCLGKVLAWTEMNKIFVELLRSFDFELPNPEKPWRRNAGVSWFIHDFYAHVTENSIG